MNRKLILGVLFILTIFAGASYINLVSADTTAQNQESSRPSTNIVISQVYGGGGSNTAGPTYKNDYIELFNLSAAPASLNGLALQYGSATGQFGSAANNIFALPDVTLQPGQHYLVQTGQVGTAGADLPVAPDVVSAGLSMAAGGGKVALTNTTTALGCGATATPCVLPDSRIVDLVAYGTSNNGEGGVSAGNGTAFTNVQGAVRNANGCTDTDNNSNDFTPTTNPVPRNLASPATPCGGATPTPTPRDANVDFNGDNKTDFVVTRDVVSGAKTWYSAINGSGTVSGATFGSASDVVVPEDYDGDNKDDIAVWRAGTQGFFYILQSQTNTFRGEAFGQTGDDPKVTADYDGDNKADPAVYRASATQGFFYSKSSISGNQISTAWGGGLTTRPNVGDYDGDNKADFCVHYDAGSGIGNFALLKSTGGSEIFPYGLTSDRLAPGDYDGDGKSDFTLVRNQGGSWIWFTLTRSNVNTSITWGLATDTLAPGDYDGDGKQDPAVWRPETVGTPSPFYARRSSDGALQSFSFGAGTDYPAANWFVH